MLDIVYNTTNKKILFNNNASIEFEFYIKNLFHSSFKFKEPLEDKLSSLGLVDIIPELDKQIVYSIERNRLIDTEEYDKLIELVKNDIFDLVYCYKKTSNEYMRTKLEEYFKTIII